MLKITPILLVFLLIEIFSVSWETPPPPGAMGPYLNGVFPQSAPGVGGSWELEDPLPGVTFQSPVRIIPFPNSEDLLLLSKLGEVWRVSLESRTRTQLLDIKDRAFKGGEAGVVGMVLHPKFGDASAPDKQLIFIFYRSKPQPDKWDEKGYNRLSKFSWDPQRGAFDPDSEEVLIQQYDRSTWHNGGAMFFGPDGFLYLSLGDEGHEEYRRGSTQNLSGGLFSGILRIDVDNDPARSHPIRRQPRLSQAPPAGWWPTYTQGYSIPNDNPWLSPDGSALEEYYALGLRSPFTMFFDPESQEIWVADVGGGEREEISRVEKGDNLQWPYVEGTLPSQKFEKPAQITGREKSAWFEYDRMVGACIIGGGTYRHTLIPELNGKFLFADYTHQKVMALTNSGSNTAPSFQTLLRLDGQQLALPKEAGITGIYALPDGQVLLTIKGEDLANTGKIFRLRRKTEVPEPPARLSELGAFTDLATLQPAPGLIPYTVNAPLWSDRAVKKRWMALPNDGDFDAASEKVHFLEKSEWAFPAGTVFVKHFELPLTEDPAGPSARLETRFFIIGQEGIAYGLTYQWNEEGTEAFLLGGGAEKKFDIYRDGQRAFTQTWDFPSREQCMSCHNANAKFVLGVKTHQLNGEQFYPDLGRTMNQLVYLDQLGVFRQRIGRPDAYVRAWPVEDESADLDLRIRSYMDANCAACHRVGGVPNIHMDLRFNTPTALRNIINIPASSLSSDPHRMIVRPGAPESSELWVRDVSTSGNRMPPVGRNLVDEPYIAALTEWIGQLSDDAGRISDLLVYPNPGSGGFSIRISDEWQPPYTIRVRSITGQLLREEQVTEYTHYLDMTQQAAGTYLLEVSGNGQRQVQKVVVW